MINPASSNDDPLDPSVLSVALEAMCGNHKLFPHHFKTINYDWQPKSGLLESTFMYPLFGAAGTDIDALVEYIYQSLVPYCLPREEVRRVTEKAYEDKDMNAFISLGDRARELFVRTSGAAKSGGEAGELILYLILEALVKAPLLVSKMSLKTNSNMNVHGRDGVHVRFCPKLKALVLHLGEAKFHKELSKGVDEAIDSITQYLGDRALRAREVSIIHTHMDLDGLDTDAKEHLKQMLNPYVVPRPPRNEIHTCLIGFDYPAYGKLAGPSSAEVEAAFREQYAKRASQIADQIREKAGERLPPPNNLQFFVMAFPNVALFRKTFAQKIGVGK